MSEENANVEKNEEVNLMTTVADPPKRKTTKKVAPKKAATKKVAPKAKASAKPAAKKSNKSTSADDKRFARASDLLKMMGDPTRTKILRLVANDRVNVGSIADALGQAQPAVSHHLALLRASGVLESEREGKENFYQPTAIGRALLEAAEAVADAAEEND